MPTRFLRDLCFPGLGGGTLIPGAVTSGGISRSAGLRLHLRKGIYHRALLFDRTNLGVAVVVVCHLLVVMALLVVVVIVVPVPPVMVVVVILIVIVVSVVMVVILSPARVLLLAGRFLDLRVIDLAVVFWMRLGCIPARFQRIGVGDGVPRRVTGPIRGRVATRGVVGTPAASRVSTMRATGTGTACGAAVTRASAAGTGPTAR